MHGASQVRAKLKVKNIIIRGDKAKTQDHHEAYFRSIWFKPLRVSDDIMRGLSISTERHNFMLHYTKTGCSSLR